MINFIRKVCCAAAVVAVIGLAGSNSAFAQVTDSLKKELHKASKSLFNMGSKRYLEVDLIADGLLQPATRYELRYKEGGLWINGKKLPEKYAAKFKEFYAENYRQPAGEFDMVNPNGLKMKEIFHPDTMMLLGTIDNQVGANWGPDAQLTRAQTKKVIMHLAALVAQEHLVDTSKYFTLQFDARGLLVNGRPVDATSEMRCAQALKSDNFDIKKPGASIWYNNNYRKQWMW
jgi:hypothetical protein